MALADYFKGPKHKADANRLAADLETHRQRSATEIQALQSKYESLEAKAKELGVLDLLAIQEKIKIEEGRLPAADRPSAPVLHRNRLAPGHDSHVRTWAGRCLHRCHRRVWRDGGEVG